MSAAINSIAPNPSMRAQSDRGQTADIVDMVSLLDTACRRREFGADVVRGSASLLSIRQSLRYQASIGPDDMPRLQQRYRHTELEQWLKQIRQLLNTEFGSLRVHRYRHGFAVGHRDAEQLVAGLLRVQYHARQLTPPQGRAEQSSLVTHAPALAWGVGRTLFEADEDRRQRRRPTR